MGKLINPGGGSGGEGSDECTATRKQVLEGFTAITSDSDDESTSGEMKNITARSNIHYDESNFTKVVPADQSFVSNNSDGVRRVLMRYSGEEGFITGNTLFGVPAQSKVVNPSNYTQGILADPGYALDSVQVNPVSNLVAGNIKDGVPVGNVTGNFTSDANAGSSQILSGYTAYVRGNKVTGSVAVQSILSFSCAVYSSTAISFFWQNPVKGAFSGVIIVGKTGSYPEHAWDGTRYYQGFGDNPGAGAVSSATVWSFAGGNTYYFRAFSYALLNNAEWIHGTTYVGAAATTQGIIALTSSGIWTVPAGVRSIDVFCVGGGGGGDRDNSSSPGHGGGGGYTSTLKGVSVYPGQQISYVVGAGGGGALSSGYAGTGGATSFGAYISAAGGKGCNYNVSGGSSSPDGGSGGGAYAYAIGNYTDWGGGNGGMDGSNGFPSTNSYNGNASGSRAYGTGQGTTTRAFGESWGTLYAGGGGGGAGIHNYMSHTSGGESTYYRSNAGIGGAGGGGNGAGRNDSIGQGAGSSASPGHATTGGGGGGGCWNSGGGTDRNYGKSGGSGVILVRWGY